MRITAALVIVLAASSPGCAVGGGEDSSSGAPPTVATAPPAAGATQQQLTETSVATRNRDTVVCFFDDLVGVVLDPKTRRIEVLETNQEFAGDTGLPPTGTGKVVATLTRTGLSVGERCRDTTAPKQKPAATDLTAPYPEKYPTWLRCGIAGAVTIDAAPHRDGYLLTIGEAERTSVRAVTLPDRRGNIAYAVPTCRRFAVNDNIIP